MHTPYYTVAFWPNDRFSILVASSSFRSANLFRSLTLFFRRSPAQASCPQRESAVETDRACAATHCARATHPSYIYKGRYPRRGQSVLARFRSGDDRSAATPPWPCFRASHDLHGEINDPYVRENRTSLRGLNRGGGSWLLLFFFIFGEVQFIRCVSRQSNQVEKGTRRKCHYWILLPFSSLSFLVSTRMMNDSTIPVGVLHGFLDKRWRFSIWIWWKQLCGHHAYGPLGGFRYLSKLLPLSIPQGRSACEWPRVVNHDTRGKSHKNITNDDSSIC